MNNNRILNRLHEQMSDYFKTKKNPNWKSILSAIAESDQEIADLIEEVRKQFFINTASRPYLDLLASNLGITRPKTMGMDDVTFRKYIPILAYQPKQVKSIIDQLLDVFFFKEAVSSFAETINTEPYFLKDGYELIYTIDNENEEIIPFYSSDFLDISQATSEEVAFAINKSAKYSYAIVFENHILKKKSIKLFTKTIGSKGSISITGGRAEIFLNFDGIISNSGSGNTTEWAITKIGDTVRFQYVSGDPIGLSNVQIGDVVIIDIPGNSGSFVIENINLSDNYFEFSNLLATTGTFDHATNPGYYLRFLNIKKNIVINKTNRAVAWEIKSGEIIVEMPASPPVVRRDAKGSAHLNGMVESILSIDDPNTMTINDTTDWPSDGKFILDPTYEILTYRDIENNSQLINGRFNNEMLFSYNGISGNTLLNIYPALPNMSEIKELDIAYIERDSSHTLTIEFGENHNLNIGNNFYIHDVIGDITLNGAYAVSEIISDTSIKTISTGSVVNFSNDGQVRIEKVGMFDSGVVYLTSAIVDTGLYGPYFYDPSSVFVLSSYIGKINTEIQAGSSLTYISLGVNNIPTDTGFVIFDYGKNTQEGPIRYLYKSQSNLLYIDPSYIFQYSHSINSEIVAIRRKGAVVLSGLGKEFSFYITDPSAVRSVIQDLIQSVKSVGMFLRFIIRYPNLYYSDFDIYN